MKVNNRTIIILVITIISTVVSSTSSSTALKIRRKTTVDVFDDVSSTREGEEGDDENCLLPNELSSDIMNNPFTTCTSNSACNGQLCRLITPTEEGSNKFLVCDEGYNFEGMGWPALCGPRIDREGDDEKCIPSDEIPKEIVDNPNTLCTSNSECYNGNVCRLVDGLFLDCDEGNHFAGFGWPPLCDNDIFLIDNNTNSNEVSREGSNDNNDVDCIPMNLITLEILDNPNTVCTSNSECNGDDVCRLINVRFLDCDEGNNLEGIGWPALCNNDDDIFVSNDVSNDIQIDFFETTISIEESSSPSDVDNNVGGTFTAPPSSIVSDVGSTTSILDEPVIRSDCVDMSSNDYAVARENDASDCSTNSDCSIGMCRLAVGADDIMQWLLCDEGDFFTWWQPLCEVEDISLDRTEEDEDIVEDEEEENTNFGLCFPGTSRVSIEGKKDSIPMSELRLGDSILVDTKGTYETVYTFGHYAPNAPKVPFAKIRTRNGSQLTLSERHMVVIQKMDTRTMTPIPASRIKKGDTIIHVSGKNDVVVSTEIIHLREGMYAPFTASGYLVVDNILVSNYVAFITEEEKIFPTSQYQYQQRIAHAFNGPHRMYCTYFACGTEKYNEEGISLFAERPYALSKWIFGENNKNNNGFIITLFKSICFSMILLFCGIFFITEQYTTIAILLISIIIIVRLRNNKSNLLRDIPF